MPPGQRCRQDSSALSRCLTCGADRGHRAMSGQSLLALELHGILLPHLRATTPVKAELRLLSGGFVFPQGEAKPGRGRTNTTGSFRPSLLSMK